MQGSTPAAAVAALHWRIAGDEHVQSGGEGAWASCPRIYYLPCCLRAGLATWAAAQHGRAPAKQCLAPAIPSLQFRTRQQVVGCSQTGGRQAAAQQQACRAIRQVPRRGRAPQRGAAPAPPNSLPAPVPALALTCSFLLLVCFLPCLPAACSTRLAPPPPWLWRPPLRRLRLALTSMARRACCAAPTACPT